MTPSFILSLLVTAVLAKKHSVKTESHYQCQTFSVPIQVDNVTTVVLPFPPLKDQYQATSLLDSITDRYQSTAPPQLTTLTGSYNIEAEYCQPTTPSSNNSTLQILTHGIGFNRTYWDFYLPSNQSDTQYSYISSATAAGHSTLSYNRLGIRGSTLANPYTEVQASVQLDVLVQLTTLARQGKLPIYLPIPQKVIHVGHSYGSQLTNALAAAFPTLTDGVVLTGFSHQYQYQTLFVANSNLLIASVFNNQTFPSSLYSTGYQTWPSQWSNQYSFFAYPAFDPAVLAQAEATKQPFTIGEFISSKTLPTEAPGFKGPVLYVVGQEDLIFCASNCTGLVGPGTAAFNAFNGTSDIQAVIVPHLGHGLNLHLNASGLVYAPINDWVSRHGF